MIKVLGISGSRIKNGNMTALLEEALAHGQQAQKIQTTILTLDDKEINPCNHCNWCVRSQTREKYCLQEDGMDSIYPKLLEADAIMMGSPAHFGRLSGLMADMIDRTRAFVHGKVYRLPLKNKIGGAMAVAFFRGGGIETTLSSINMFFYVHQMIVATSGLYQLGAGACSSREGKGRFEKEIRHMVLEDDYGVSSAKLQVERAVELARIFKAGQKALEE